MLRRLEFDRQFGIPFYIPASTPAQAAVPAPVAKPEAVSAAEPAGDAAPPEDTDYSPAEVAGLGLPVAENAAERASALARLKTYADACLACALGRTRTRGAFGVGDPDARLMVIGEAPGYHEDQQGEPFVGRAGELLDRQLKAIHLPREAVYIANTLKCRPPDNRDPAPDEKLTCQPYLMRQIQLVQPELILAVGGHAARWVLGHGDEVSLGRMRGRIHDYQGVGVVVTYHPAFLLREGRQSPFYRKAWDDLKRVRDALGLKRLGDPD